MRQTLRARMGWLHGWVGFVAGLALAVVFAGGTLAMFDTEIGRWMQPEVTRVPDGTPVTPQALEAARVRLEGSKNPLVLRAAL